MIKRRIDDFYDAIRAQDVDRIAAWFAPHARHRVYAASAGGQREFAGEHEGVAAIRARFADFRARWTIRELIVVSIAIEGATGAAQLELRGRATSSPTTFAASTTHFLTFADGYLIEFDVFIRELQIRHPEAVPPSP